MVEIPVYGRGEGRNGVIVARARVDDADEEVAARHRWYLGGRNRAFVMACTESGTVLLHRLLLAARPEERVIHRSGDHLDNRRANLLLERPRTQP